MSVDGPGRSRRWTAKLADDETKPIGPEECARRAVGRLGPFKHKLQDDAERLGPWEGLRGHIALSEELAFEQVSILAREYNKHARLSESAPRTKDVVENLLKLENLAGELARYLVSLDDITRHRLQTGGTGISDFADIVSWPLMEAADVGGLPTPAGWSSSDETSRWVERLESLSRYANFTLTTFLRSKAIESVDIADKGGKTDLHTAIYGSARWSLVNNGWCVYEIFKAKKATGTEGGPFHSFLSDIFEYATGRDPEEHSKLTYWLKHVCKANRQYAKIRERQAALREEADRLVRLEMEGSPDFDPERRAQISSEMRQLEDRRAEAWPLLFPYSYSIRRQSRAGQ